MYVSSKNNITHKNFPVCKILSVVSTCAVYRQEVLTAQNSLKAAAAAWLARSPALEICELSLARKKKNTEALYTILRSIVLYYPFLP